MPEAKISDEAYTRVQEFKQVIEAVIDAEMSFDDCVETILKVGINSMLADILAPQEPGTLLQQLGSRYPAQVYRYVAETLKTGTTVQQREALKRRLGFRY